MPNPAFHSVSLCTHAPSESPLCPRPRLYFETLPGVDGEYAQAHGHAGRQVLVRGLLCAEAATPAQAQAALKTMLRQRQDLADGVTLSSYVGSDGHPYTHCVLLSYQAVSPVSVSPAPGGVVRAVVLVEAAVRQLAP